MLIIAILLAIAIPTFLGVTSSANDRAAQSNLTNGLTEATAQYQSAGQSFSGARGPVGLVSPRVLVDVISTGTCGTTAPNCISVGTYDVATLTDQQGLVLAAMSKTGTCWYVAQLQATPALTTVGATGWNTTTFVSGTPAAGMQILSASTAVTTAGTYYAKKATATTAQCQANYIETRVGGFLWGTSFSAPGVD